MKADASKEIHQDMHDVYESFAFLMQYASMLDNKRLKQRILTVCNWFETEIKKDLSK